MTLGDGGIQEEDGTTMTLPHHGGAITHPHGPIKRGNKEAREAAPTTTQLPDPHFQMRRN